MDDANCTDIFGSPRIWNIDPNVTVLDPKNPFHPQLSLVMNLLNRGSTICDSFPTCGASAAWGPEDFACGATGKGCLQVRQGSGEHPRHVRDTQGRGKRGESTKWRKSVPFWVLH